MKRCRNRRLCEQSECDDMESTMHRKWKCRLSMTEMTRRDEGIA